MMDRTLTIALNKTNLDTELKFIKDIGAKSIFFKETMKNQQNKHLRK